MNILIRIFKWLFTQSLRFYPPAFRAEFGAEMQSVFANAIADKSGVQPAIRFMRELGDLPGSLLSVYAAQWFRGGNMSTQNEHISPSTRWQALIGVLPFLAFGIFSMIGKMDQVYDPRVIYTYLAFYILALSGLLIGWIRGFPLWSYGYLGWSLVFAWIWSNVTINGTYWGYQSWMLFWIVVLIALLWTRSLSPIKKIFRDIWNDWTRLTFVMYAFAAFVSLIYDENHHPYLLLFMAVATLIVTVGAWFFLRSSNMIGRILSIVVSFIAASVPMGISYLTWDWRAYYGFPTSETWYDNLGVAPIGILFWLLILFWPALIALIHRITPRQTTNP
jgi:hypothetical protein